MEILVFLLGIAVGGALTDAGTPTTGPDLGDLHVIEENGVALIIGTWSDDTCEAYVMIDGTTLQLAERTAGCQSLAGDDPRNARMRLHLRAETRDEPGAGRGFIIPRDHAKPTL